MHDGKILLDAFCNVDLNESSYNCYIKASSNFVDLNKSTGDFGVKFNKGDLSPSETKSAIENNFIYINAGT